MRPTSKRPPTYAKASLGRPSKPWRRRPPLIVLLTDFGIGNEYELLAIFGSSNHLEISLSMGNAKGSLRANKGTRVEVSP